jgi:hypothetical protein
MRRGAPGQWVLPGVALLLLAGCASVPEAFHPPSPIPPGEFSHRLFDEVLRATVADGVVVYPAVRRDERFARYVAQLDHLDPAGLPTRADRLAFWINAYNAFAIQGILEGYSPASLAGRYRYFLGRDYRIGGERINLYDLERHILIPGFREPRIHFAIVCASRSCPKLRAEAYAAERLEEQLEDGARVFINDASRNRFDRERKVAQLSMIFKWFEDDFAERNGSLLGYVARYVADPQLGRELASGVYTVEFLDYDWRLNGPSPQEALHAGRS